MIGVGLPHRTVQLSGRVVQGLTVSDVETTSKTLPDFPGMWQKMIGHP